MSSNKVGTVVVTYNRLNLLKEVIEALNTQDYNNHDIIIVNNGSTDGTEAWLNQRDDLIVINQDNIGGAGGFFTGIKYATEKEYDYCWIMDDDVIPSPTALSRLIEAIQLDSHIGFVCSRVIGIDGRPMNTPTPDFRAKDVAYSDIYDKVVENFMVKVRRATFVSVLISTKSVKEFGLPIKEYFIWGDDSEYTERISAERPCYIVCNSIVTHKRTIQGGLSIEHETDAHRLKNYRFKTRNELYSLKLHHRYKDFFKEITKNLILALKLLIKGKMRLFMVIVGGTVDSFMFSPKICFPMNR